MLIATSMLPRVALVWPSHLKLLLGGKTSFATAAVAFSKLRLTAATMID
jgi:hypothetical protein